MISTIWYYFDPSFSVSPFLTFPRITMTYLTINFSSAVSTKYLWLELCSKVCNGKKGTEEMKTNFLNSLGKRAWEKRPIYPAQITNLIFFSYSITLYVILNQLNKLTSKQGALIKVPLFWKSAGQITLKKPIMWNSWNPSPIIFSQLLLTLKESSYILSIVWILLTHLIRTKFLN